MKLSIFILSLVLILSTSPHLNAQEAEDSEQEIGFYTENVLTKDFCGYDETKGKDDYRKGINQDVVKLLETYIDSSVVFKEDGTSLNKKGSLTVNEDGAHLGERVFNFEKLQADIIAEADPFKKECLRTLFRVGIQEWQQYYNNLSEKYNCGIELKAEDKICGYKKNNNKYLCEDNNGDNKLPDGMTIGLKKESARNYEKLHLSKGEKKNTCTKTEDGEDLEEYISDRFEYIAAYNNNLFIKDVENNKQASESADKSKSEAGLCPEGRDCGAKSAEQKTAEVAQKTEEQLCCDSISENWVPLGFATIKGSEPSPKICKDMFDKDKVGEDKSFIAQCIKNIAGAFTSSAVNSFLDFFSTGWITNIPMLIKELATNFPETIEKIGSEMIGLDRKLLACVNENTRHELYCSMAGKFIGSNAGFGIAMGGVGGAAVSALTKAAKFTVGKTKTTNSLVNKLAKSPSASKGILKSAASGAGKGAKAGVLWPVKSIALAGKGALIAIKGFKKIPSTFGNTVSAAVTGTLGVTAKGAAKVLPKDSLSPAGNLGNAFSQVGDALFTSTKSSVDNIFKSKGIKEIKDLEAKGALKYKELGNTKEKYEAMTAGMTRKHNGKLHYELKDIKKGKEIEKLEQQLVQQTDEVMELSNKIIEAKATAYKKHLILEQKDLFNANVERIRALNKRNAELKQKASVDGATGAQTQNYISEINKNTKEASKLKVQNEAVKKKIQETVDTKISTIENSIFNGVTATSTAIGTGALQVEKMKGSKQKSDTEKSSVEKNETKKVDGIPVPTAPPPGVAAPAQEAPVATPTTKKEEAPPKASVAPSAKQTEPASAQTESGETKAEGGGKKFADPPPMD